MSHSSKNRFIAGLFVGVFIISIGAVSLVSVKQFGDISFSEISWTTYLWFYLSVSAVYGYTIVLWSGVGNHLDQPRSMFDSFIDTGLMAVGKYVPGKIIGIAMRGAVQSENIKVDPKRVKTSFGEQICVFLVGVMAAIHLKYILNAHQAMKVLLFISLISSSFLCVFLLMGLLRKVNGCANKKTVENLVFSLKQSLGYLVLWGLSSVPILLLVVDYYDLSVFQMLRVLLAFTLALLSGWLAFFTPNGVGVREASFVAVAPDFMQWHDAAAWVILHRILVTLFDISYGLFVSILIVRKVQRIEM